MSTRTRPHARGLLMVVVLALGIPGCRKSESAGPGAAAAPAAAPVPVPTMPGGENPAPMVRDVLDIDGQSVTVEHSALDIGRVNDLFDDKPDTLARTTKANPAVYVFTFSKPRTLKGIEVTTATMDVSLRCVATLAAGGEKTFSEVYRGQPADPTVKLEFPGLSGPVQTLRVDIGNPAGGDGHIHVRTVKFL
ncbi:MAG TPA: hypothetical protein VMH79_07620 [Thermoanaerobaculia bacterium]|nr:hypothetical protein [Thermoanaerobaculia bacterium]